MLYDIIEPSWKVSINAENYHIVHNDYIEKYTKTTYRLEGLCQAWAIDANSFFKDSYSSDSLVCL